MSTKNLLTKVESIVTRRDVFLYKMVSVVNVQRMLANVLTLFRDLVSPKFTEVQLLKS